MSNVAVMRSGFRSVLSITNTVHFCVSSARHYSKKGIGNNSFMQRSRYCVIFWKAYSAMCLRLKHRRALSIKF